MITEEQYKSLLSRIVSLEEEIKELKNVNEELECRIDDLESVVEDNDENASTVNYEDNSEELAAIRAKNEARARELEEKKNTPTIIDDLTIKSWEYNGNVSKVILLSDNLTEIGAHVFNECENVVSLEIPAGVQNIGSDFCYRCLFLRSVTFQGPCPEGLEKAFVECWRLNEIFVPQEEIEKYKKALPKFTNSIQALK